MLDPVLEPFHVITKDSSFHEIFKLKKDWRWENLDSLKKDFFSGKREKGGAVDEGVLSLGGEHLKNDGTINYKINKRVSQEFADNNKNLFIEEKDILIVKDGATTGKVSYVYPDSIEESSMINEHLFCLRLKNKEYSQYVFEVLRSEVGKKQIDRIFHGSAQGGINKQVLYDIFIPLPDKEEIKILNKRITNSTEEFFLLKELAIEIEIYIQTVRKNHFIGENISFSKNINDNMPYWDSPCEAEWKNLEEICKIRYGKGLPEKNRKEGDVNVYSSGGIDGKHDQSFYFDPSIIIGRKGSIGSLQYVDEPFWAIDTTYIVDEPAENVKLKYVYEYLKLIGLKHLITVTTKPGINRDYLYNIKVPIPEENIQIDFINKIEQLNNLKIVISELFELVKSKLHSEIINLIN
jgi:type I restriction enzyme, S subunit